jgi:hypothetical protein
LCLVACGTEPPPPDAHDGSIELSEGIIGPEIDETKALLVLAHQVMRTADPDGPPVEQPTTATRIEEDDPSIQYAGPWFPLDGNYSGGSATQAMDFGTMVTVEFHGTGIRWLGAREPWTGVASVFLDGWFIGRLDTYSPTQKYDQVLLTIERLPLGDHTLTIEPLMQNNTYSTGAWVWIDAFEVLDGPEGAPWPMTAPTRFENTSPKIAFSGPWHEVLGNIFTAGSMKGSVEDGAQAKMTFFGSAVEWIAYRDQWSGFARVYLNDRLVRYVDGYSLEDVEKRPLFSVRGLDAGQNQQLIVEATHQKSAAAKQRWVWIDAFDVYP